MTVRPLTAAEVAAMNEEVRNHVNALARRWEESGHTDYHALLGALFFVRFRLPDWLFTGLRKLVETKLPAISDDELRHEVVAALREVDDLLRKEAHAEAVNSLKEHPTAHGKVDTMKRAYDAVERKLRPSGTKKYKRSRKRTNG